jgi:hypothetical protein
MRRDIYTRENAAHSRRRWNDNIKENLRDILRRLGEFEISGLHERSERSDRLYHLQIIKSCLLSFIRKTELSDTTYIHIAHYQTVPTYIAHFQRVPTYIALTDYLHI